MKDRAEARLLRWLKNSFVGFEELTEEGMLQLRELRTDQDFACLITEVPKEIALLERLEVLDLAHSLVRVLPEEVASLKHLRELYIYDTEIADIPEGLRERTGLLIQDNAFVYG